MSILLVLLERFLARHIAFQTFVRFEYHSEQHMLARGVWGWHSRAWLLEQCVGIALLWWVSAHVSSLPDELILSIPMKFINLQSLMVVVTVIAVSAALCSIGYFIHNKISDHIYN